MPYTTAHYLTIDGTRKVWARSAQMREAIADAVDAAGADALNVGDDITLEVVHKSGKFARLRVTAPRQVPIRREAGDESRRAQPHACHVPSTP